jgi:hypothetical protein
MKTTHAQLFSSQKVKLTLGAIENFEKESYTLFVIFGGSFGKLKRLT